MLTPDIFVQNVLRSPRGQSRWKALAIISMAFLFAVSACAQVDRTSLNGTVTDPSKRVLPSVKVQALDEATGLLRETITSASGTYDIPELPVGTYTLTFSHSGFQSLR